MGLAHFKILIFSGYSSMGRLVKFCHPLQVANFSMLLVQNSLHYVKIMTFESIIVVFLFRPGMFQRIKNQINFTKFKALCSEVSFTGLQLKKMHTTLYLFCFQMSCVVFWNKKKVWLEKKFEYFFIGSEHP